MPDTQINVCKAKPIMKDLDQLEDEATAMRSVYLEGGSWGDWGISAPNQNLPGSSGGKFCLSEIRNVPDTQINVCKKKPIIKDLDHKKRLGTINST